MFRYALVEPYENDKFLASALNVAGPITSWCSFITPTPATSDACECMG